jgi:MFS family permease
VAERRGGTFYGWIMLPAVALAQVTSWGILYYGFTVFLAPMGAETGWSSAALSGAFSLGLAMSGLAAVPVGRWLDRHGPRLLMTCGSLAAALLLVAWSRVTSLAAFYLIWLGLGVCLATVLYEPAFWLVATWFRRQRGRALTLLTFIGGFASVVYIPLTAWLVRALGWREALLALAAILAVGTIPIHALLLRRRPTDLGLLPDGAAAAAPDLPTVPPVAERSDTVGEALHGSAFWFLAVAFFLATLATGAVFVHLIPYLVGQGYDSGFAAWATGLIGIMGLPGRLFFTPLGGYIPRRWVTAGIFALQTLALVVLLTIHSRAGVLAFVVLFGAGFGAITPARAALLADFYGPAHYGRISSVLSLFLTGSRALAPVGAGLLYTLHGGYGPALWTLTIGSALGTVAVLFAEHRPEGGLAPGTLADGPALTD